MQATIEERFIFQDEIKDVNYIRDNEGQVLGFQTLPNGNKVIYTTDTEGIEVAIENCADGTKIFHMTKDSKGLPAMHEIKPDGQETICLFDSNKRLEKMIEVKSNKDKVTHWYSANDDYICQEQRQKGGILFKMKTKDSEALIWLHTDGKLEFHGDEKLQAHLKKIFSKFLDGADA